MRNVLKYILLFLTAIALQLFVLEPLRLGMYVNPLAYVAFIVLLPMNAKPVGVLLSGLVMGVSMDFFTGAGGLHTVVTLFTAYMRQFVMPLTLGRDNMHEGGMPSVKLLGTGKFIRYVSVMVSIHCLAYFTIEALNWKYYYIILLKTAASGTITVLFVWLVSLLFTVRTRKKA